MVLYPTDAELCEPDWRRMDEVLATQLAIQKARMAAFQEITATLAVVRTPEEIAGLVMRLGAQVLGAVSGAVRLLSADGAWLEWLPAPGYQPGVSIYFPRNALSEVLPFTDAVRSGEPIWIESPEEGQARYPEVAPAASAGGVEAAVALPLLVDGRTIGAVNFNFAEPRAFDAEEREFVRAVAGLTAQALERARLYMAEQDRARAAEERAARLATLQEVSAALATVHTPEEIAGVVMAQGSRALGAASGLIRLLSVDGAWLEQLQATGYQPDSLVILRRIAPSDPTPHGDVLRSGLPVWLGSVGEMEARYPASAAPLIAAGYRATATLPLLIEGRILGTLGFGFAQMRAFEPDERDFIRAMAGLTAQALERARLYVATQARAQAAEELARLRSDFLASVSHELRTPLAAVVGYGELLQARWSDLSEVRRQGYLQRILLSANRQVRLVEDLLLVGIGDLGALPLVRKNAALAELARQAAEEVQCSYPDQSIDLAGPTDVTVVADCERVVQVLANVLDNAAKCSPVGSAVLLRWGQEEGLAVVRIFDHGPGIPEEHRAKLFTPFGRLPQSRMRAGRVGTGLGLYLGRRLAEAMGGQLDLEETGAGGSTFRLRLPLAASPSSGVEQLQLSMPDRSGRG